MGPCPWANLARGRCLWSGSPCCWPVVWQLGIAENLEVEKAESLCVWGGRGEWGVVVVELLLDQEEVSLPAQLNVEMLSGLCALDLALIADIFINWDLVTSPSLSSPAESIHTPPVTLTQGVDRLFHKVSEILFSI